MHVPCYKVIRNIKTMTTKHPARGPSEYETQHNFTSHVKIALPGAEGRGRQGEVLWKEIESLSAGKLLIL